MSVEDFVRAMPKVALHVQLEGALDKRRLLQIAEQNEIADELKRFDAWVALLENPDYERLLDLMNTISQWLRHPDDLTHAVYELGVTLAKQNVRYAEVHFNPIRFTENNWTFEQCLDALNDGRDRAERGWGVQIRWMLTIGRDQPRHADEIVRWASSATGRHRGIVGMSLGDPEGAQPVGQFDRALHTAAKKEIAFIVHAGLKQGSDGVAQALEQLEAPLLFDGWGVVDSPDVSHTLAEKRIPLIVDMKRAICHRLVGSYREYPLRALIDSGITVSLSASMPSLYQTTLNQEYLAAIQDCGLSIEKLEQVALNTVEACQLPADEKRVLAEQFVADFAALRSEHLAQPTTSE